MTNPMKKSLLSVSDVMQVLNVSRRTIYYWIDKGILKAVRIGNIYRFHPEDIEAMIARNTTGEAPRKKRILVVDDDVLVRESLKSILEREGFDLTVVSSGKEAIMVVGKEVFDLVIVDVRMPEMNGIETLKAIRDTRAQFAKPPLPEIIITAYDDLSAQSEIKTLSVRAFLHKPFDLQEFLSIVRKNVQG